MVMERFKQWLRSRVQAVPVKAPEREKPKRSALEEGAFQQRTMRQRDNWQPIDTAPRDGTIVELRNNYGVAPSYSLSRWTNEIVWEDGTVTRSRPYSWRDARDSRSGTSGEGDWLMWRPFVGDAAFYADPTGGLQMESAYWRGALATQQGSKPDGLEHLVQK